VLVHWQQIYSAWQREIEALGGLDHFVSGATSGPFEDASGLFRVMPIHRPGLLPDRCFNPDICNREGVGLQWIETESVEKLHRTLQFKYFDDDSGRIKANADLLAMGWSQAADLPNRTLRVFWDLRNDPERLVVTLIRAILRYDKSEFRNWTLIDAINHAMLAKWGYDGRHAPYAPHARYVLPAVDDPDARFGYASLDPKISTVGAFVASVARYSYLLFRQWTPLALHYVEQPDSKLVEAYVQLKAQRARAERLRSEEYEARRRLESDRRADRVAAHPLAESWPPSNADLQKAVWSMPTVAVAKLYGVSDVAVAKRCTSRQIPKPPRGFWEQVLSNKRPHPNGVPVVEKSLSSKADRPRRAS
jgi:hypothetical protein